MASSVHFRPVCFADMVATVWLYPKRQWRQPGFAGNPDQHVSYPSGVHQV